MRKSVLALCALGAVTVTTPAYAATLPACQPTDLISAGGSLSVTGCEGFFDGNLLAGNSTATTAATADLSLLGYDGTLTPLQSWTSLSGSGITFNSALTGTYYLGVHFGNGVGSPGGTTLGDSTAFYSFNATNLAGINFSYNSSSGSNLYGGTPAVPEPATWALMLLGFGGIGVSMRRRKPVLAQIA
jgi:hypothetical protein